MKCQQCGSCCKHLVAEADWIDALREPRLLANPPNRNNLTIGDLKDGKGVIKLSGCFFLVCDECCIYPTRPNNCVGFKAGSEQCNRSREKSGLETLEAKP